MNTRVNKCRFIAIFAPLLGIVSSYGLIVDNVGTGNYVNILQSFRASVHNGVLVDPNFILTLGDYEPPEGSIQIGTTTYRIIGRYQHSTKNFRLLRLDKPVLGVPSAIRARSVPGGNVTLYLVSYTKDGEKQVFGTTQSSPELDISPFEMNYTRDRTPYEAKIDKSNPYDRGGSIYFRFGENQFGLVGLLADANNGQFAGENILGDVNNWIDHTMLALALGIEVPQAPALAAAGPAKPVTSPAAAAPEAPTGPETRAELPGAERKFHFSINLNAIGTAIETPQIISLAEARPPLPRAIGTEGVVIGSQWVLSRKLSGRENSVVVDAKPYPIDQAFVHEIYELQLSRTKEPIEGVEPVELSKLPLNELAKQELLCLISDSLFAQKLNTVRLDPPREIAQLKLTSPVTFTNLAYSGAVTKLTDEERLLGQKPEKVGREVSLVVKPGSGIFVVTPEQKYQLVGMTYGIAPGLPSSSKKPVAILDPYFRQWVNRIISAYGYKNATLVAQTVEEAQKPKTPVQKPTPTAGEGRRTRETAYLSQPLDLSLKDLLSDPDSSYLSAGRKFKVTFKQVSARRNKFMMELLKKIDEDTSGTFFTLFIPTDEAIESLAPGVWEAISDDLVLFAVFLKSHMVFSKVTPSQTTGEITGIPIFQDQAGEITFTLFRGANPPVATPAAGAPPVPPAPAGPAGSAAPQPFKPWGLTYEAPVGEGVVRIVDKGIPLEKCNVYLVDKPIITKELLDKLQEKNITTIFR